MNRTLANERLWQFKPVHFEIDADELVSVDPFIPDDINIFTHKGKIIIDGTYGIDIFPNHQFEILVKGQQVIFTKLEDIPLAFDNVIRYQPDDTHDITFTYTLKKDGVEFKYTHWIHHDMEPWERLLPELLKRETNGGWNASSN